MAELILTEEEKAAENWLELDDAIVGKMVKAIGVAIGEGADEIDRMRLVASAYSMVSALAKTNSEKSTFELENFTVGDKSYGDWMITIEAKSSNKD